MSLRFPLLDGPGPGWKHAQPQLFIHPQAFDCGEI